MARSRVYSQWRNESNMIRRVTLYFSVWLLAAVPAAALYTGEVHVLRDWLTILTSPCPLVTDYYLLGSLPATFLNAGLCGLVFSGLLYCTRAECAPSTWAGYFLVIAHGFYGLNFLNIWFPMLGILLYIRKMKVDLSDNLDMAMFSTAFGPFFSELLFRYPYSDKAVITLGDYSFNFMGLVMCLLLATFLGFAIPAMLPGAQLLHRGFNLYNGGLAFGLLGLLIYAFLYKTMGVSPAKAPILTNPVYEAHGESYAGFCNAFFLLLFGSCVFIGWCENRRSFAGLDKLWQDTGYRTDFVQKYGIGPTWLNLGSYGLMMLLYFDAVILFTRGAGFTGATCGVLLAAMTFAAGGQHIFNVWPILAGFALLSGCINLLCVGTGLPTPWTLSTQGYMNAVAFATGLCPFTGKYGKRIGLVAGLMCAVMCTSTSAIHGGFVLYNGGLTAGITALILTPFLDLYYTGKLRG